MNFLITGGAGFFGSKLAEHLLNLGHLVTVYDNLYFGNEGCIKFMNNPNYTLIEDDIRNRSRLEEVLRKTDVVVHMAAYVGEPVCKKNSDTVYEVNTESTKFISDICSENNIQFVFLSTCSNYGKNSDVVNEESPLNPLGLYSDSKILAENYIIENSNNYLIFRCSTLFGVSNRMRYDLTINQFLYEILTKHSISVFGEEAWRPYIHIDDACQIIMLGISQKLTGVYNIGDESLNYTKKEIIEFLKKSGLEFQVEHIKWDDPRDYKVDFSKLYSKIDYKIKWGLKEGFLQLLNHIKEEVTESI